MKVDKKNVNISYYDQQTRKNLEYNNGKGTSCVELINNIDITLKKYF